MSRRPSEEESAPSAPRRSLASLRRAIEQDPPKGLEILLAIASTYPAARHLGPWAAALVSGLCAAIFGLRWSLRFGELGRSIEHYSRLALVDDLTGLANDRSFREGLTMYSTLGSFSGEPLSLVLIDVDQFKSYNDTFGHPAGDEALKALGRCLVANSGEGIRVYRVGGDEFALILPKSDRATTLDAAGRMRLALANLDWPLRPITASFGIATITGWAPAPDVPDLRLSADRALYRAKALGGDRVVDQDDEAPTPD